MTTANTIAGQQAARTIDDASGRSLLANGYTFKGYAESMPAVGFTGASYSYHALQNQYDEALPLGELQQYGTAQQANAIPANLNVPLPPGTTTPGSSRPPFISQPTTRSCRRLPSSYRTNKTTCTTAASATATSGFRPIWMAMSNGAEPQ